MSATVRIPTILRTYTGGAGEVTADGSTLSEVLDSLEGNHPGIRARILDDSGALRRFVNVYVGDDDVRFIGGLDAQVAEGTKISIIPAVAGGAASQPVPIYRKKSKSDVSTEVVEGMKLPKQPSYEAAEQPVPIHGPDRELIS